MTFRHLILALVGCFKSFKLLLTGNFFWNLSVETITCSNLIHAFEIQELRIFALISLFLGILTLFLLLGLITQQ